MKKLILLCFLISIAFSVNAQTKSFDETVIYINSKTDEQGKIKADKNGNIIVLGYKKKFNFFDLDVNAIHYKDNLKRELGLELVSFGIESGGEGYQITANIDDKNVALISHFSNRIEAERVFKALIHLRSLCVKIKDPFD